MRMPEMDGYQATKTIKGKSDLVRTPKIIALTASAYESDRAEIFQAGCDDVVHKPFREREIFEVLSKHLGIRYIYEEPAFDGREKSPGGIEIAEHDLADFEPDWLRAVHNAAKRGEADELLRLIEDIHSNHPQTAKAFEDLIHRYRFDKIAELTSQGKA